MARAVHRTSDLVQRLQIARRELALESALAKLDKYSLLILDDIAYVSKDQAETSVLFELIGSRYERRSMLITANQPFGAWGKVFPDQAMTLAAIDRLVHHATILEMNVESYRRRAALDRKRGSGRPPTTRQSRTQLIDAQRQSNRHSENYLRTSRLKSIITSLPAAASNSDCRRPFSSRLSRYNGGLHADPARRRGAFIDGGSVLYPRAARQHHRGTVLFALIAYAQVMKESRSCASLSAP